MIEPTPTRIFEDVSVDLFSYEGSHYLVYADRLSGWPTVDRWKNKDPTSDVTRAIRRNFMDLGVPLRLRSDGGPQFASSAFEAFIQQWGVEQVFSSPHYPQANGHAEAAVKAMKYLIQKASPSGDLETDSFAAGKL